MGRKVLLFGTPGQTMATQIQVSLDRFCGEDLLSKNALFEILILTGRNVLLDCDPLQRSLRSLIRLSRLRCLSFGLRIYIFFA